MCDEVPIITLAYATGCLESIFCSPQEDLVEQDHVDCYGTQKKYSDATPYGGETDI